MEFTKIFMVCTTLTLLCSLPSYAQKTTPPPSATPTPAPAPAPETVILAELLHVAGPFAHFLDLLQSSKVIDTFQAQINNTEEGITLFVPKDDAFKSLKSPSLSNLTKPQLEKLLLFHALAHYYSLAEFRNLSKMNPITTFAGGVYTLNFSDVSGTPYISSGWTKTKVSSSVHATDPVAIYQIDRVLLPEAIFGTDIPPTPAPTPAPAVSPPDADSPSDDAGGNGSSPKSSPAKSSAIGIIRWGIWGQLMLAISGLLLVFL